MVAFICVSLVISDAEHLFLCLLAICVFGEMSCLGLLPIFLVGCLLCLFVCLCCY